MTLEEALRSPLFPDQLFRLDFSGAMTFSFNSSEQEILGSYL
jgi:hypothetical protein